MSRRLELLLLCLAPMIWGSTYIITTELLPQGYPLTTATLRALPAGLLLLLVTRSFPKGVWLWRSFVLGAFNFALIQPLIFVAAYRLPGGVAGTIGAITPLLVLMLSAVLLGHRISALSIFAGIAGVAGVAMLVLTNAAALDWIGVAASMGSALLLAFGTIFSHKWRPPVSALSFTGWQMAAGGLILLPFTLFFEPSLPPLTGANVLGFAYLGLIGGVASYFIWFRGIGIVGPSAASSIGLMNPVTAVLLGLLLLNQTLAPLQIAGLVVVLTSVWFGTKKRP